MNKGLSDKINANICLWMILLLAFYYPMSACLSFATGISSTILNIAIRSLLTLVAIYLILIKLLSVKKISISLNFWHWSLVIFWIIYSIRIIVDIGRGIEFAGYSTMHVFGFAFGNILIPIVAILIWGKKIELDTLSTKIFKIVLVANLATFATLIIQNKGFDIKMFLTRSSVLTEVYGKSINILNPISIGLYGELLALLSAYSMIIVKNKKWIINMSSFLLGLSLLFLGASRGPFLGFVIGFFFLVCYSFYLSKSKMVLALKFIVVTSILIASLGNIVGENFTAEDFYMLKRVEDFLDARKSNEIETRDLAFISAWNDFLDSPVIGKQFVGTFHNFYPHNIFVETFMATGLLGAIFFYTFILGLIRSYHLILKSKDRKQNFILIIHLPVILSIVTSGCLFMGIEFWMLSTLLIFIAERVHGSRKLEMV